MCDQLWQSEAFHVIVDKQMRTNNHKLVLIENNSLSNCRK